MSGSTVNLIAAALAAAAVGILAVQAVRGAAMRGVATVAAAVILIAVAGGLLVLTQIAANEQLADRRAIEARAAELLARDLLPGSPGPCLTSEAGDAVETACEKVVFASPETAAMAVALVGARLTLFVEAATRAREGQGAMPEAVRRYQRAFELDRFGIAAHVLAIRDGCSADHCSFFDLIGNSAVLKSNLRTQAYENYADRYAAGWATGAPVPPAAPDVAVPVAKVPPVEPAPAVADTPAHKPAPVASKYDFPSAASIPPVSIMASEPPQAGAGNTQASPQPAAKPEAAPPVPPRRPQ